MSTSTLLYIRPTGIGRALGKIRSEWLRAFAYGFRFWISICTALSVAFWLELDQPYWAATSAAIACLPQVGASLRKGWLRVIGTATGAMAGLALAACFPQDRVGFLLGLAAWGATTAFATTLLRNYSSYAAALSGYTAAIIAGGSLGATGGVHADLVFHLAVSRFSEICIGIVCAGVIRTITDQGDSDEKLAVGIAKLSSEISRSFRAVLSADASFPLDLQPIRRDFIKRLIGLEPLVDGAMAESSGIRFSVNILRRGTDGLAEALASWRAVDVHLRKMPDDEREKGVALISSAIDPVLAVSSVETAERWISNPRSIREQHKAAIDGLLTHQVDTPGQRLLIDKTAEFLSAMSHAAGCMVLLKDPEAVAAVGRMPRIRVSDYLPAALNALRTFITMTAVSLLWIVTGWPNGSAMMTFALVVTVAQVPRGDGAFAGGLVFAGSVILASLVVMVTTFAILPTISSSLFQLILVIGIVVIPLASLSLVVRRPTWLAGVLATTAVLFMPFLEITNPMEFEASQLFNRTPAFAVGCLLGAAAFRLMPPLSPRTRIHRLLRLTLREVQKLAGGGTHGDWSGHIFSRLSAMPATASPVQRASLIVALSVGTEIVQLRQIASYVGLTSEALVAFKHISDGRPKDALEALAELDDRLALQPSTQTSLRGRAGILVLSEALAQYSDYFAGRIPQ